ncbi:hypothetical protein [Bacillus sp. FSL K6-3431]
MARYTKTGADIIIKYNWLEQPPRQTINKTQLAKNKDVTKKAQG